MGRTGGRGGQLLEGGAGSDPSSAPEPGAQDLAAQKLTSGAAPVALSVLDPAPTSYEQAMDELERLVHGMEGGGLSLEQSLAAYQRGAGLVAWCRRSLSDARQQIQVLEGELLKPFEAFESRAAGPEAGQNDEDGS